VVAIREMMPEKKQKLAINVDEELTTSTASGSAGPGEDLITSIISRLSVMVRAEFGPVTSSLERLEAQAVEAKQLAQLSLESSSRIQTEIDGLKSEAVTRTEFLQALQNLAPPTVSPNLAPPRPQVLPSSNMASDPWASF